MTGSMARDKIFGFLSLKHQGLGFGFSGGRAGFRGSVGFGVQKVSVVRVTKACMGWRGQGSVSVQ